MHCGDLNRGLILGSRATQRDMKGNRRRQPFHPAVPVARNLGGCSSEVSSSVRGRSSESSGMAKRSASISRRMRTMSISFSRKTTFTSFTFTSSEDLAAADSTFGKGKFIWQIRTQYYKGGIVVRKHAEPSTPERA